MAFEFRFKIGLVLMLLSIFFIKMSFVVSIPTQELDAMLSTVRARGYNLFSNAITTSDLQLDLLTAADNASFTFFAPTDSSLFALAMTQSASTYTATLRYHGLPRRLSVYALTRFPYQVPIPTLLRSHYVSVTSRRQGPRSLAISVNGVDVVLPGLYYGRHVAVHGLGGILSLHSQIVSPLTGSSPLPSFLPRVPGSFPPEIDRGSETNRDFAIPPADRSISISSVSPPISPSDSSNKTVDLPFNREFLGPARAILSVSPSASPGIPPAIPSVSPSASSGIPPAIHSVSPSASPGIPPAIHSVSPSANPGIPPAIHSVSPSASPVIPPAMPSVSQSASPGIPPAIHSVSQSASPGIPPAVLTPSIQNEKAEAPTQLIGSPAAGETALMMESEDGLSGRSVEGEYEALDWMTFGFSDGNSNDVHIEDSHPHPNSLRGL